MKKKIIIMIVILLLIICGVIAYFVFKDNSVSTITLDINPSMELKLDKEDKVIKVKALNVDAKKVISDDLKGLEYDEAIMIIINKVKDELEINDDRIVILINSTGELDKKKLQEKINDRVSEQELHVEVIVPNEITEEDKELAKKYDITEAKASYLNSIKKEHENVNIEEIVNRDITELSETERTGKTCPDDYKMDGDFCKKEINRVKAIYDKVCPEGYLGKDSKCYLEGGFTEGDTLTCMRDFTLKGTKCVREETAYLLGRCEEGGDYRVAEKECHYREDIGPGVEYCRITPGEDLLYNGRCLGRKPTINGGCLGSDKVISGWCYDTSANSGYEAEWKCPDGSLVSHKDYANNGNTCYKDTFKPALEFYCEDGYTLENDKCYRREEDNAFLERKCNDGYTLVDNSMCLDLTKSKDLVDGYRCDDRNSKLVGDICIVYEVIDAK